MDMLIAAIPAAARNCDHAQRSGLDWPVGPPPPPGSVPADCAHCGRPGPPRPDASLIRQAQTQDGHTTSVICLTCALATGLFGASPTQAEGQNAGE